ncbi:MAG: hypothetical protein KGI37_02275 [Alphaproteobacteria bacterium]|nr:hypothetical protein [Alphaproteobacteria bacterium]
MPQKKTYSRIGFLVTAAVVMSIIVASLTLSVMAYIENQRFLHSANQIMQIVNMARTAARNQQGFAQTPGTDALAALRQTGQILPSTINDWDGMIRATVTADGQLRMETDLPPHECRRLGLYFISVPPSGLGLTQIEARRGGAPGWTAIYPLAPNTDEDLETAVETACGNGLSQLALIFRFH